MSHYRLFCVDGNGAIAQAEWIEADNDASAIELVSAKKVRVTCEIWAGHRLVAEIPAYRADDDLAARGEGSAP